MNRVNEDRFADILEQYGDTVYSIALVRLQRREDAEDIFQETFFRLLRSDAWTGWDDEHIKAWLIKVTLNLCRDLGRGRSRESTLPEEELQAIAGGTSPDELQIWDVVNTLGEPDRSLIHLFYGEDIPLKECAKLLDISYSNARVIIHRARKKIRKELDK